MTDILHKHLNISGNWGVICCCAAQFIRSTDWTRFLFFRMYRFNFTQA